MYGFCVLIIKRIVLAAEIFNCLIYVIIYLNSECRSDMLLLYLLCISKGGD